MQATGRQIDPTYLNMYRQIDDGMPHKTIFSERVERFLGRVNNTAREIMGKDPKPVLGTFEEKPKRCCDDFTASALGGSTGSSSYHHGGNMYVDRSVTVLNGGGGGRNDDAAALCMLGTAIFLACAAVWGYCYGNLSNTSDEIEKTKRDGGYFANLQPAAHPHIAKINEVYQKYSSMLERRYNRDWYNCAMAVAALTGGALLALGAVFSSFPAMVIGGVIAAGVGAVSLFKLCYSCARNDPEHQDASDLHKDWKSLKINSHARHGVHHPITRDVLVYEENGSLAPKKPSEVFKSLQA